MQAGLITFFAASFFLLFCCSQQVTREEPPVDPLEQWDTDISIRSVPLREFKAILPRDVIPPIDDPVYWNVEQASGTYFEHEPVMAIDINGDVRAYPLSVLMYHEIVNDVVGNVPVSVTYCPLCNAAIVFDRRLEFNDEEYLLNYGTSGMLRKSDLVMWDRQTETWWQQLTGEALVGELTGATLTMIPSVLISFNEFIRNYPDGQVLSTDTGYDREYGKNVYVGYDDPNNRPDFFDGRIDERLPAMERVINITVDGNHRVYPLNVIKKEKVINDSPFGKPIVIFHQSGTVSVMDDEMIQNSRDVGAVGVFDPHINGQRLTFQKTEQGFIENETNTVWTIAGKAIEGELQGKQLSWIFHGNHFAFAWLAFYPNTEIYGQ